jgi:hypothetical protein
VFIYVDCFLSFLLGLPFDYKAGSLDPLWLNYSGVWLPLVLQHFRPPVMLLLLSTSLFGVHSVPPLVAVNRPLALGDLVQFGQGGWGGRGMRRARGMKRRRGWKATRMAIWGEGGVVVQFGQGGCIGQ